MKKAQAGSVESNDILITVSESDTLEINITSIVSAFFYDQIYQVITINLNGLNLILRYKLIKFFKLDILHSSSMPKMAQKIVCKYGNNLNIHQ